MKQQGIENLRAIFRRSRLIVLLLVVLGAIQMNIVRNQQGPLYNAGATVVLSPTDSATALAGLSSYVDPNRIDQTEQALANSRQLFDYAASQTKGVAHRPRPSVGGECREVDHHDQLQRHPRPRRGSSRGRKRGRLGIPKVARLRIERLHRRGNLSAERSDQARRLQRGRGLAARKAAPAEDAHVRQCAASRKRRPAPQRLALVRCATRCSERSSVVRRTRRRRPA